MGHQLVLLHVLVCLAVQLKVGLKLRVVAAELALVDVAHHAAPLLFGQRALRVDVGIESLQAVRGVAVTHSTLVEAQRGVIYRWRQRGEGGV